MKYSISQMVLDIVGDLLIKIKLAQKLALAACLCLTVLIMACTIMRIAGLSYYNTVDATWETFWQFVAASIGLTMSSVAAFRSLFISHQVSHRQQETSDFESIRLLFAKVKQAFRQTFSIQSWRTKTGNSKENDTTQSSDADQGMDLGEIERGTITGLRSFIHKYQRTPVTASQVMYSQTGKEVDDYRTWPLPDQIVIRGATDNRGHSQVPRNDGSGRHEKILGLEGSRHDKMLTRQESHRNHKVLAANSNDEYDTTLARPKKVRSAPVYHGNRSVTTTGDSEYDGSDSWLRSSASGKMTPKTRVGMMSKLKCGGIVFSAGFKAERYREEER
ncbi:MAG: hypothetical protein LQ338_002296 [Usnochroma carphineum]|nr:MAG: hypothetical protein LQ338_002296 [Usnochroma carphineum]